MPHVYVIANLDGAPPVWRFRDVLPEVRLFEDGEVAEYHAKLAVKNKLIGNFKLIKFASASLGVEYINEHIKEHIWTHVLTLSQGYDDKYKARDEGSQIQTIVPMDGREV